jgi:hypothetical protein
MLFTAAAASMASWSEYHSQSPMYRLTREMRDEGMAMSRWYGEAWVLVLEVGGLVVVVIRGRCAVCEAGMGYLAGMAEV